MVGQRLYVLRSGAVSPSLPFPSGSGSDVIG